MRYIVPQQPIIPQYYPPNTLGQPAAPMASSSLWIIGGIVLGLFLWSTSERKHSRLF